MKNTIKFQAYNEAAERSYWYVEYIEEETETVKEISAYLNEEEADTAIEEYLRVYK